MYDNPLGFDFGRQLYVDQRRKVTVAYCNHFVIADDANYNMIHGKFSAIKVIAEDFTKGKGKNAVWCTINLTPTEIRTIYNIVKTISPVNGAVKRDFYHPYNKLYTDLLIERSPKLNNPWVLTFTNGSCVLKNNSWQRVGNPTSKITVMYTDDLFYSLFDTLYSRLRDWEAYHYFQLLEKNEVRTNEALSTYRAKAAENKKKIQNNSANKNSNDFLPPPPDIPEDDIPFESMPDYNSAYFR